MREQMYFYYRFCDSQNCWIVVETQARTAEQALGQLVSLYPEFAESRSAPYPKFAVCPADLTTDYKLAKRWAGEENRFLAIEAEQDARFEDMAYGTDY